MRACTNAYKTEKGRGGEYSYWYILDRVIVPDVAFLFSGAAVAPPLHRRSYYAHGRQRMLDCIMNEL